MMLRRLLVAVAGLALAAVVNAPASLAVPHDPMGGVANHANHHSSVILLNPAVALLSVISGGR